jgi:hypothetical protein
LRQIVVEDGEAKFRIVQTALRQVKKIAALVSGERKLRELPGEIWREYGVS